MVTPKAWEPDVRAKATYGQKWGQRQGPMDKKRVAPSLSGKEGRPLFTTEYDCYESPKQRTYVTHTWPRSHVQLWAVGKSWSVQRVGRGGGGGGRRATRPCQVPAESQMMTVWAGGKEATSLPDWFPCHRNQNCTVSPSRGPAGNL